MHPRLVITVGLLLCAVASGAYALEATTRSNDRASNAALVRHLAAERADQFADLSAVEAQVNGLLTCTRKGKFYTPGESGADADGCTAIQVTVIE
jgi:hypothetical protein